MKKVTLFILLLCSSNTFAQQVYGVQRGQRGYIPPPKYEASVYITTLNAYEELEKVLPKSVEVFSLDDFEKEIFKEITDFDYEILSKRMRELSFLNKGITISILEPIKPDYSKEEFLGILEKTIYSELKLLN